MQEQVEILGVLVDRIDLKRAVEEIERFIAEGQNRVVVTPNAEMIVQAQSDLRLKEIINRADLALPDGIGVVLAAKLLGSPIPERGAGIDLVYELLARSRAKDYRFYFLGGAPGVAEQAAKEVRQSYGRLNIATHHGYLSEGLAEEVINDIIEWSPDILLVGMGVPLQEKWLATYRAQLSGTVGIGVGGTFDILAGVKDRAPLWVQQIGLEWLYRLRQEPKRLGRILRLPEFIIQVLKQKFNHQS